MGKRFGTVFVNGKIYTANPKMPFAECMTVKDGRIACIGSLADMDVDGAKTLVDLQGKRVLPGFVDSHMHPILVENLMDLNQILLSQGVTTIADMCNEKFDAYLIYEEAHKKDFQPRVSMYYSWQWYKDDADFTIAPEYTDPEARVRIAGIKLIADGSASGKTTWCDPSYLESNDCGIPVSSLQDFKSAIRFCKKHRCQLAVHALGANAVRQAIDLTWKEGPWTDGIAPYTRLEHVAMPSQYDIKRAAEAGIAFVTQPVFLYAEIESYMKNIGIERTQETYPLEDWMDAGVPFSFSTDAPTAAGATPSAPMVCLKGAVTGRCWDGTDGGQRHRMDIRTAIDLYTAKSAPMLGFTNLGMLKPGYFADFILLDRDILEISAEEIDQVKVEETYIDGECVYRR